MSRLRRVFRSNILALLLQQGSTIAAGLGLQVYLAASMSKTEFGTIAFIGSVLSMVTFVAHMQCHLLIAREVAKDPDSAPRWLTRGLQTVMLLTPIASAAAIAWVALQDGRPIAIAAAALATIALLLQGLVAVTDSILQGLSKMTAVGPTWVAGRVVIIVATVLLVEGGWSLPGVYIGQALSLVVVLILLLWVVRQHIGPWPLTVPMAEIRDVLQQSVPFAGVTLFASIYVLSDVILLEAIRGTEEVAVYKVASLAVVNLPMLALIITRTLYPRAAAHSGNPEAAGEELSFAVHVLLVLSMPMAMGGMLVAEPLIEVLPGPDYSSAVVPMLWLFPMVPLRYVLNGTGVVMLALNQTGARARGLAFAALLNVVLNLILIPIYGAAAAAATTLLADVFLIAYQTVVVRQVARGVNYWRPLVRIAPALAAMTFVVRFTPDLQVFVRIGIGALVYGVVLVATGAITRRQIGRVIRL